MFIKQTKEFEKLCKAMHHKSCECCLRVSLNLETHMINGVEVCKKCLFTGENNLPFSLPVWTDDDGSIRHDLPPELKYLRECEKLLIQQIAVVVPLLHLKIGQIGSKGHCCSFMQDIREICNILPRMPENIRLIKIIKNKISGSNEIQTKAFKVRRLYVLNALKW
jgi:hypothetical protein